MRTLDTKKAIDALNAILETELAGVVRYMHYSFMIYGHARIPIVKWMRAQADESLLHAAEAGEFITALGGHRRWRSESCSRPATTTSTTSCRRR